MGTCSLMWGWGSVRLFIAVSRGRGMTWVRRGVFGCWGWGGPTLPPPALSASIAAAGPGQVSWQLWGIPVLPALLWEGRAGPGPHCGVPGAVTDPAGPTVCTGGAAPWALSREEGGLGKWGVKFTIKPVKSVQSPFCLLVQGGGRPPACAGHSTRGPPAQQPRAQAPAVCHGGPLGGCGVPSVAAPGAWDAAACSPALTQPWGRGAWRSPAPPAPTTWPPLNLVC